MPDLLIPFLLLLCITILLIIKQRYEEDKIIKIFNDKFEIWKKNENEKNEKKDCKELVGLVFLKNDTLSIKMLNNKIKTKLEKKIYIIE